MQYAFDEIYRLLGRIKAPYSSSDPVIRYVCAMFAELAYYHTLDDEVDEQRKRVKLLPCNAYNYYFKAGIDIDVQRIMNSYDIANDMFIRFTKYTVIIGIQVQGLFFIAFRGTAAMYDWKINLDIRKKRFYLQSGKRVKVHKGFLDEVDRVVPIIHPELQKRGIKDSKHVFVVGHSLGGATATLFYMRGLIPQMCKDSSVVVFGTPRVYHKNSDGIPVYPFVHIRRPGDFVPNIPPKLFGYGELENAYDTNGEKIERAAMSDSVWNETSKLFRFIKGKFKQHSMESYRWELAKTCGAEYAETALVDLSKGAYHR